MATSSVEELLTCIVYFSGISALVLFCYATLLRQVRTNRLERVGPTLTQSRIDRALCLELPGDGLFAIWEFGPAGSSFLSGIIVLFIIVPMVCFWDCILLGMLLAHIERWPARDGIWYVLNGVGYRIDSQDAVSITDDAGRIAAIVIFCHLYALVTTILGFSSLLRGIRLLVRRMPEAVYTFISLCWLLVPILLALLGLIVSLVLSGVNKSSISSSFLLVMDYSLTGGSLNIAPVGQGDHGGGLSLVLALLAVWTLGLLAVFLGIIRAHIGSTDFMSFLEGIDPELHPLQRLHEDSKGRAKRHGRKPYALSAADLNDLMPGHHPRSHSTFEDVSQWLKDPEIGEPKDTVAMEKASADFLKAGATSKLTLPVAAIAAENGLSPRYDDPKVHGAASPTAVDDVTVSVHSGSGSPGSGKAFGGGDIQDLLRSLKSGMGDGAPGDGVFRVLSADSPRLGLTSARDGHLSNFGYGETSPSGRRARVRSDLTQGSSASSGMLASERGPSCDIDDLGGSMVAISDLARAEEAESRLAGAEERARNAENVAAQESMDRMRLADELSFACKKLNQLDQTGESQRQLEEAHRRAQHAEQKYMTLFLERSAKGGTEGRRTPPGTPPPEGFGVEATWPEGEQLDVAASQTEIASLHEQLEAVELKLSETEKALLAQRARANAAEARLERATIKEKLLASQLKALQALQSGGAGQPLQLSTAAGAESEDCGWGLDDGAEDVEPAQNGGDALEKLKEKQREEQNVKELNGNGNGVPEAKWRINEFGHNKRQDEEPWQLCSVRDCAGRGGKR